MNLTRQDGSPAPRYLKVTRTWTYDVGLATESLAEFTDRPITYDDVYEMITSWMVEDVREPMDNNLAEIEEIYDVTEVTSQQPNEGA